MLFPFCFVMSCSYYIKKLHFIQGLPSIIQDKRMNNYNIHFKYIYYFLSF